MTQVWYNGAFLDAQDARLSIADRGFTLADGIFETILGIGEKPVWFPQHLHRLRDGASQLGLHVAFDDQALEAAVVGLLRKNGFVRSAVRITLTRGPASKRGLWVDDQSSPTLLMTCAPSALVTEPQRLIIARSTRRNEYSPLSRIKSLNYGDSILARREALSRGATDALMLNGRGYVVCATVGNLFVRINGEWVTPPVSDGILPGIVINLLRVFGKYGVVCFSRISLKARTVHVYDIITPSPVRNFISPRIGNGWVIHPVGTLTITGLQGVQYIGFVERNRRAKRDIHLIAVGSFFRRDHDYTVASAGTVNGRCRTAFQDVDRLDLILVDVVDITARYAVDGKQWSQTRAT